MEHEVRDQRKKVGDQRSKINDYELLIFYSDFLISTFEMVSYWLLGSL